MRNIGAFKLYWFICLLSVSSQSRGADIYFEDESYFDALRAAGLTFEGLRFGQEYFENNFAKLVLDGDPTGIIGGLAWSAEKFVLSNGDSCTYYTNGYYFWPAQWQVPFPDYSGDDAICYSESVNHQGNTITVNRYYAPDDVLSTNGYKFFFGADIEFNNQKILMFNNFGRLGGTRKYVQERALELRPDIANTSFADNFFTSGVLFGGPDAIDLPNTDDDIFPGFGSDYVDGGGGFDRVELALPISKYVVNKLNNGAGYQVWNSFGVYKAFRNVELIRFWDGSELDQTYQGFWGFFCPSSNDWAYFLGSDDISYDVCVRRNKNTGSTNNVWRFFNTRDNAFFYTSSREEAFMIWAKSLPDRYEGGTKRTAEGVQSAYGELAAQYFEEDNWPYMIQGTTFAAATYSPNDAVPLWRFYNYQTGHHFFTVSNEEKDFVIAKSDSGEWPFNFEGEAFKVYTRNIPNSRVTIVISPYESATYDRIIPVYRLYSPSLNRHFFSANEHEIRLMKETGKWNDEGIGFWAEEPCLSYTSGENEFLWDGTCVRP